MTKSRLPQPENITIIGEPTKNQTDFPPKITLPNTKKASHGFIKYPCHIIWYTYGVYRQKRRPERY